MEQYGLWPTALKQYRSTLAAGAGLGGHQPCPITPIEIGLVPEQAQQFKRDSGFFGGRSGSGGKLETRETLFARRANAPTHFPLAECRWGRVDGPLSSVIVTLIDLRSTAHETDKWKSSPGDLWETWKTRAHTYSTWRGPKLNHTWMFQAYSTEWICAVSAQQLAWLSRKELRGQAGIMKAAAAGGLWPVARLHVSDEHHDGLCPRCLPEGTKAEETVLRRVWQCLCNPTGGIFSVTERWRTKAEDQHSSAACSGLCGLVLASWTVGKHGETKPSGVMTWKPDIYFVDGSGGKYPQDARLRRVGWSIACLKQNAELKEACMGQRLGKTNSAAC